MRFGIFGCSGFGFSGFGWFWDVGFKSAMGNCSVWLLGWYVSLYRQLVCTVVVARGRLRLCQVESSRLSRLDVNPTVVVSGCASSLLSGQGVTGKQVPVAVLSFFLRVQCVSVVA